MAALPVSLRFLTYPEPAARGVRSERSAAGHPDRPERLACGAGTLRLGVFAHRFGRRQRGERLPGRLEPAGVCGAGDGELLRLPRDVLRAIAGIRMTAHPLRA